MTFKSGLIPYSERERADDARRERKARLVALIRRNATPSGQNYHRPPTERDRRFYRRLIGEPEPEDLA